MNNVWFTSDEHFGHKAVINFCNRPFKDIEEQTEELIKRHNEVVKPGDLVYHLGDMFWRTLSVEEAYKIVKRLNGQKYYIFGNHEEIMRNKIMQDQFIWCKDLSRIHPEGAPHIILAHYAMLVWEGSHKGDWQLYGHSHGELSKAIPDASVVKRLNSFDVGVDCHDYYPVSLDSVKKIIEEKQKVSGLTWHNCPACHHKFYNFSKYDEICSQCLTKMEAI